MQQVWFPGNHSDVGASYLENESRLSDISLKWMTHAAMTLPDETEPTGAVIKVNPLLLQLRPDPLGPQHDEREPGFWGFRWPKGLRHVDPDFQPASGMNPETLVAYQQNILRITRQVKFNPSTDQSVDVVLSVNGLPVVTLELKNPMTRQNVEHANAGDGGDVMELVDVRSHAWTEIADARGAAAITWASTRRADIAAAIRKFRGALYREVRLDHRQTCGSDHA